MKTIYNNIPDNLHYNYLNNLINRVFKILPLKEENSPTVQTYIVSLLSELTGNKELIAVVNNDSRYETILSNLQSLVTEQEIYRTIVFNTINLIVQMKDELQE